MKRTLTVLSLILTFAVSSAQMNVDGKVAHVSVPKIPTALNFAGEKVPVEYPDIAQAIQREVITTCNMHTATMLTLLRSARWIPVIKPILEKNGIPSDFIYLCLAESGMNPEVVSPAKAAGMWQFTAKAAKEFGLETGENVDLRYNIEEATEAACRYLRKSYDSLGNWTLAAASYNIGIAGVVRRLKVQGVKNYWDMNFPEETMRYLPRIMSFKLLLADPAAYGFDIKDDEYFKPYENYIMISISDQDIDWNVLALSYGSCFKMLRLLNPWIRSYNYSNKSGRSYNVKVPDASFRIKGY